MNDDNTTPSIVTRNSGRKTVFRQHLRVMDTEKAEFDLAQLKLYGSKWRQRDKEIFNWLNQIPKEVDEDVNMDLLALRPGELNGSS